MHKKSNTLNTKVMETLKKMITKDEIKFIMLILAPIISAVLVFSALTTDLAAFKAEVTTRLDVIESNHLVHLQDAIESHSTELVQIQIDVARLTEAITNMK